MDDGTATAGSKRVLNDSGEPDELPPQPHPKRLRAANRLLLDILDDDRGPADPAAPGDLATVMRSLEEEIAALSPCPQQQCLPGPEICEDPGQSGLGFLLEASDDDLGLPPTLPQSSDEGEVGDGDPREGGNEGFEVLGNLWAFDDDDRSCHEAMGFGRLAEGDGFAWGDGGVAVDGDLFGNADVAPSEPSELSDLSWRPEYLPAV